MDHERDRRPGPDPALTRSRPRFRPPRSLRATRAGWCFIAIIFGVGFAALNTGNNLLYLVLALMLAFLVLSGLLSETSLRGIRVKRMLPRELIACSANRIVLRIHNDQKRIASFAIVLDDHIETVLGPEPAGRAFALRVGPGKSADRSYVFEPQRRGDLQFDRVRVSTRFPFGLFVKSAELDCEESALVYPQLYPTPISQENSRAGLDAPNWLGSAPQGDDVAGLREFVPGDSLGRVHWKRSLRSGRLLVGEREGDAANEIEVLLRLPVDAPESATEERVALTASQIVSHLDAGLRVGLRSPTERFAPSTGIAHRHELLTYLARVTPEALDRRATAEREPNAASEEIG